MDYKRGDWIEGFPGAVTVCDLAGITLELNARAAATFADGGGKGLVGRSLVDCHPEPARSKLLGMLADGSTNTYTIEKNGVRKLIHQAPWFENGVRAGMVEFSFEIPAAMPHFVRKPKA